MFYLLADLVSWRHIQLMIANSVLTNWFKVLETAEDEEEKMQILSASWFSVLETSTTDDGGHWFNSFDFKS